jgi:hypothetical protein
MGLATGSRRCEAIEAHGGHIWVVNRIGSEGEQPNVIGARYIVL